MQNASKAGHFSISIINQSRTSLERPLRISLIVMNDTAIKKIAQRQHAHPVHKTTNRIILVWHCGQKSVLSIGIFTCVAIKKNHLQFTNVLKTAKICPSYKRLVETRLNQAGEAVYGTQAKQFGKRRTLHSFCISATTLLFAETKKEFLIQNCLWLDLDKWWAYICHTPMMAKVHTKAIMDVNVNDDKFDNSK